MFPLFYILLFTVAQASESDRNLRARAMKVHQFMAREAVDYTESFSRGMPYWDSSSRPWDRWMDRLAPRPRLLWPLARRILSEFARRTRVDLLRLVEVFSDVRSSRGSPGLARAMSFRNFNFINDLKDICLGIRKLCGRRPSTVKMTAAARSVLRDTVSDSLCRGLDAATRYYVELYLGERNRVNVDFPGGRAVVPSGEQAGFLEYWADCLIFPVDPYQDGLTFDSGVFFDAMKVVISRRFLLIMRWSGHPGDLALAQNSVAAFYFRAPFCEYLAKFLLAVSPQSSSSVSPSSTSPDVTIFAPVYESRRVMELIRLSIYDRWEKCVLGLHSRTSILEMVLNSAEVALLAAARADLEWPGPPGSYGAFRDQDLDDWRLRPLDYYVYPAYYVENAIVDLGTLEEVDHGTLEEADY
jgi:hypothetical protein